MTTHSIGATALLPSDHVRALLPLRPTQCLPSPTGASYPQAFKTRATASYYS